MENSSVFRMHFCTGTRIKRVLRTRERVQRSLWSRTDEIWNNMPIYLSMLRYKIFKQWSRGAKVVEILNYML